MEFKHPNYYKELRRLSGLNKKSNNTNASNVNTVANNKTNTTTTNLKVNDGLATNSNIDTTTPTTKKKTYSNTDKK